jgi:ATP-dependent Clp endopeptidase proteolytic subunit ClpP
MEGSKEMKSDIYWAAQKSTEICGSELASSDDNNIVERKNNKIYFYTEVRREKNLKLNLAIEDVSNEILNRSNVLGLDPGTIELYINSYGGSVHAGFSSVDYILNSKVPVTTIIDGCAASAATIMSVCGAHRKMNKHAYMLIHQLSSGMWGKYQEMQDKMENCDRFMEMIIDIYKEHTKIPKKELDNILKHDLWWDAATCLKYGLVDEII